MIPIQISIIYIQYDYRSSVPYNVCQTGTTVHNIIADTMIFHYDDGSYDDSYDGSYDGPYDDPYNGSFYLCCIFPITHVSVSQICPVPLDV